MVQIKTLSFGHNQLVGTLPESWGSFTKVSPFCELDFVIGIMTSSHGVLRNEHSAVLANCG